MWLLLLPADYEGSHLLKRVVMSVSAIFAGQSLNILGNLLLVPLFLSRWSSVMYGEWMALSAVVAYFGVTDLGMNSAAANAMTTAYARNNLAYYGVLQSSAMAFYLGIAFGGSLLFGFLVAFAPIPAWIGVRHISPGAAALVIWLLAARILWQMPAAQLGNVYRTMGNMAATQWLGNLQSIGVLAVTVTVLLLRGGVMSLAVWGGAPVAAVTTWAWFSLRRSHPQLLPKLSKATIPGLTELLSPSVLFGLIMLSMALSIQGPVLLVSRSLGGVAVALLVTTRTLSNLIRQIVGSLNNAMWPELTRLGAIGADESMRTAHRAFVIGSTTLGAAFAGALWFEGEEIISAWTHGALAPNMWLLRLFLVALVLGCPWQASSIFVAAGNQHRKLAYCYLASSILLLTLVGLLLRPLGILAVPIGVIVGEAIACYHFVISHTCEVLMEPYLPFAARLWAGVIAMCLGTLGLGWLGHSVAFGPPPLRWLEVGLLTTLGAAITSWGIALRGADRMQVMRWLGRSWRGTDCMARI